MMSMSWGKSETPSKLSWVKLEFTCFSFWHMPRWVPFPGITWNLADRMEPERDGLSRQPQWLLCQWVTRQLESFIFPMSPPSSLSHQHTWSLWSAAGIRADLLPAGSLVQSPLLLLISFALSQTLPTAFPQPPSAASKLLPWLWGEKGAQGRLCSEDQLCSRWEPQSPRLACLHIAMATSGWGDNAIPEPWAVLTARKGLRLSPSFLLPTPLTLLTALQHRL